MLQTMSEAYKMAQLRGIVADGDAVLLSGDAGQRRSARSGGPSRQPATPGYAADIIVLDPRATRLCWNCALMSPIRWTSCFSR